MYYENDDELKVIRGLADLALKAGGVANLETVNALMASLKPYREPEEPTVEEGPK